MKKMAFSVLVITMLLTLTAVTAYAGEVQILLGGQLLGTNGVVVDNHTLVPVCRLGETSGVALERNNETRQVTLTQGNTVIMLAVDSRAAIINGEVVALDAPTQIIDNFTFVPLNFISESFGLELQVRDTAGTAANAAAAISQPTPAQQQTQQTAASTVEFASYRQILDEYTAKLRAATPVIIAEFRAAADGITDITRLAEISVDKLTALAEISTDGMLEMANLWVVRGIGSEAVYNEYAAKLMDVYMDEAERINDVFMELVLG